MNQKSSTPSLLPKADTSEYFLFGSRIGVFSAATRVREEIAEFLVYYADPEEESRPHNEKPDLTFHIHVDHPAAPPPVLSEAEHVHRFEMYPRMFFDLYERENEIWTVLDGQDWTRTNLATGRTDAWVDSARLDIRPRYVTMALVFPILVDHLQRRSHFVFHCAGLARNGRAVLLAGPSGGGKSTLTLALLQAGYYLLADDMCVLTVEQNGSLSIQGFHEDLAVCPDVASLLPSLGPLPAPLPGSGKIRLPRNHFSPDDGDYSARPGLVLLPRVDSTGHRLVPLSKEEALHQFACSALFVTGKRGIQERTFAVIDLLEQSETYELLLGPDMESAPRVIDSALEALTP